MSLLHGYDISGYQGTTAPAGDFVIVKVTEGKNFTNDKFPKQYASAKIRAKVRGGYHYAHPEQSSFADQAHRLLDLQQPERGELVMLDLEASGLSQAKTNAWARGWGDLMRTEAAGVTSVLYMGSGYATNGTGRGLKDHFDLWMYPQYPSAYQLASEADGVHEGFAEQQRAVNRSDLIRGRMPIAAMTARWPPTVSPWLPFGLTCGWSAPHIWQFTDNWNGLDASVTALTLEQLAGGGRSIAQEEDVYGGIPPLVVGHRITRSFPKGSLNIIGIVYDSPNQLTYRVAAHSQGGGGKVVEELVVGGPASDADKWPKKKTWKFQADADWLSIELVDGDPSVPDANGKVVEPGWDASHTA